MNNSNTSPQGQSKATLPKQQSYRSFLEILRNVCGVMFNKPIKNGKRAFDQFLLIDTNAGSGYNEDAGCIGSPVAALAVLLSASFPWFAFFIEQSTDRCIALAKRCIKFYPNKVVVVVNGKSGLTDKQHEDCNTRGIQVVATTVDDLRSVLNDYLHQNNLSVIVNFDNNIVLPLIKVGYETVGLIYADPNGVKDSCEQALKTFYGNGNARRVDFLINLDGQTRNRVECGEKKDYDKNGRTWNKDNPDEFKYFNIEALIKNIGKKHQWIREPVAGNARGSRWTFLFASNFELNIRNLHRSGLVMHNLSTDKGKEVLAQVKGDKFLVSQDEQQLSLQIIL